MINKLDMAIVIHAALWNKPGAFAQEQACKGHGDILLCAKMKKTHLKDQYLKALQLLIDNGLMGHTVADIKTWEIL